MVWKVRGVVGDGKTFLRKLKNQFSLRKKQF